MSTTRLFMGDLGGGDYRARISKPGYDASSPSLDRANLYFDTAWPFPGLVHAVDIKSSWPSDVDFPYTVNFAALPYVPMVHIFIGASTLRPETKLNGISTTGLHQRIGPYEGTSTFTPIRADVYNDHLIVRGNADIPNGANLTFSDAVIVVVFKIPARFSAALSGSNVPRLLIGKRGSDYGLYASRPGVDVTTAAADYLSFSSDALPLTVNTTISGSKAGSATFGNPNALTRTAFSYTYKGYIPLILIYTSITTLSGKQLFHLPPDDPSYDGVGNSTFGSLVAYNGEGNGHFDMLFVFNTNTLYYSIIVLDYPWPAI